MIAFISRTALSQPAKIACATIAWPMLSSTMPSIAAIEGIVELNIGHAIVAHAIFAGWDNAVREMKAIMVAARLAARA